MLFRSYYGRYYHFPWYRRHSVSVSYRETLWRPGHYSGAGQRHTASVIKENRRLGATAPHSKRYRTYNDAWFRKSAPHPASRGTRSSTAAHGRKQPPSSTRQITRPRNPSTRRSETVMRRSETITRSSPHRGDRPGSRAHQGTRPRNPEIGRAHV